MKLRKLETNTPGHLYLHSMPGRYEAIALFISGMEQLGISRIVCLTSDEEIDRKSPDYLKALRDGRIQKERTVFPICDFGVPEDREGFHGLARNVAEQLRNGKNVLVHCAGGIGRTGMFAGCVLKALGLPLDLLEGSGSYPETEGQMAVMQAMPL